MLTASSKPLVSRPAERHCGTGPWPMPTPSPTATWWPSLRTFSAPSPARRRAAPLRTWSPHWRVRRPAPPRHSNPLHQRTPCVTAAPILAAIAWWNYILVEPFGEALLLAALAATFWLRIGAREFIARPIAGIQRRIRRYAPDFCRQWPSVELMARALQRCARSSWPDSLGGRLPGCGPVDGGRRRHHRSWRGLRARAGACRPRAGQRHVSRGTGDPRLTGLPVWRKAVTTGCPRRAASVVILLATAAAVAIPALAFLRTLLDVGGPCSLGRDSPANRVGRPRRTRLF